MATPLKEVTGEGGSIEGGRYGVLELAAGYL